MEVKMVDVMLHINEDMDQQTRENLRDELLRTNGVMAADVDTKKNHLLIIEYNPDVINPALFIEIARQRGLHTQLVGM